MNTTSLHALSVPRSVSNILFRLFSRTCIDRGIVALCAFVFSTSVAQAEIVTITEKKTVIAQTVQGIIVEVDNAQINLSGIVDCGGSGVGVYLSFRTRIKIKGGGTGTIKNCDQGIVINSGGGHDIKELVIKDNITGIQLGFTTAGNKVSGNILQSNRAGIVLASSSHNKITDNALVDHGRGIVLQQDSSGNVVSGNIAARNELFGIDLRQSHQNKIASNITEDTISPTGIGFPGIALADSDANQILDNISNRNGIGILIGSGSDSNVIETNTTNDNIGAGNHSGIPRGTGIGVFGRNVFPSDMPATNNSIIGNESLGNSTWDLFDGNENPACDANVWQGNLFSSRNQTCIN